MKKLYILTCSFLVLAFIPNALKANTPTITSFSPSSGPVGTLVKIIGTHLELPTAFTIGGVTAIVVSDTSVIPGNYGDTLVGMVMPGAATGVILVTTTGGTASSTGNFAVTATLYPTTQQGNKLVGTGSSVTKEGNSVSISADGNTAVVGGPGYGTNNGAIWVYTRSGGTWTQQGAVLVGTGATGGAYQGSAVSISADGNTILLGGYYDNSGQGAVWVFTRTGGIWTQQGSKLVGTGAIGAAYQGGSVSLSADGNTAIVGGDMDNSDTGAAWVFTRSAGIWTQQGSKLVGIGAVGRSWQGCSASISADGNTAIMGGYQDNGDVGAVWVFTRSGGTWTQQGSKLVGTGYINGADGVLQGYSVSLSADGNTVIIGAPADNSDAGAAWIFKRSGGIWTQQGNKLVGTGASGTSYQGTSVSISADGNTAIIGGYRDNSPVGAAWVFTRSGGTWIQQGSKLVGAGSVGAAYQGWSVALSANGSTAIVGGPDDNSYIGAAWVFNTGTTGIDNISTSYENTLVYPNPSNGLFTIKPSVNNSQPVPTEASGLSEVEVYNMLGEKVYSKQFTVNNSQLTIDLSSLPSGVYLYRVLTETGDLVSEGKFIISK